MGTQLTAHKLMLITSVQVLEKWHNSILVLQDHKEQKTQISLSNWIPSVELQQLLYQYRDNNCMQSRKLLNKL